MYLSKIILDIRHPSVRQALRDVNDMHRNLMSGFDMQQGEGTPRADGKVLYRLFSKHDQIYLLVSSRERPDPDRLAARGFYTDATLIRDVSALKDAFKTGMCFRFEALVSPCKKERGDWKNSKRIFLDSPEARIEWLSRKGAQGGFEILYADEIGERVDVQGRRGDMVIKNSGVVFSGLLRIMDAEAFWESYTRGIGPGKAYGMGMLNLSRA